MGRVKFGKTTSNFSSLCQNYYINLFHLIEGKVYEGDLRGAVRLLTSDCSLAPDNPDTLASLQDKHPLPLRPVVATPFPQDFAQPLSVSSSDVADAIGSFQASSAGGLDGLRPQHLKELIAVTAGDGGQHLLESLVRLCNFLLKGDLNPEICPYLYGASLCALEKKDGGIRPIAVGSVIRRLIAKLGCRAVRDEMAVTLNPHQLGFGTPLGCEAAIHAVRLFASDPKNAENVILKVDIKNAFNSIERDVMLTQARAKIPSLCPFLEQCYVSPTNLFFNGHKMLSQVGAQQGDPLGPLLFSLAIHDVITSLGAPLNIWYLDDGTIGGAPEVILRELDVLITRLASLGLIINSAKCELFPCGVLDDKHALAFRELCPNITIKNKLTFDLLGALIFLEGVPAALDKKRRTLARAQQNLGSISSHVALILFRSCLSLPKLTYTMRTSPTWFYPQEIALIDEDIRIMLESILNVQLEDMQWTQASLPIRHGGLGIRRMQDTSVSAFLASSHGVVDLVANILNKQGDEVCIPFVEEARNAWSLVCPSAKCPEKPAVQRLWDEQLCKSVAENLLSAASGEDRARLKAVSLPESGAWLHAIPSPFLGTLLDDGSLRIAVALRLGSTVCNAHKCRCGISVDTRGYHGLSCKKSAGRHSRHHTLNDVLRRALVSAGVPCTLEPPGLSRTDGKRPDGLTLVPWERGRCLVWDATCVSTFAASHLPRTMRSGRSAAEWAAEQKHIKYAPLKNNYLFLPFAVEVSGAWCDEARAFVREIGRRLRANGSDPRSTSYLTQRISLVIQRGNAASVMGTFGSGTTQGIFD